MELVHVDGRVSRQLCLLTHLFSERTLTADFA